jgi:GMP synthase PP-ATPase subunit
MTRYHTEPRTARLKNGYYSATVESVKDLGIVESTYGGETTERHKEEVIFSVSSGNGSDVPVKKRVNVSGDSRSTAWAINNAITGTESNDFDSDDWVNKPCEVLIEVNLDANGNEWENIKSVLPSRTGGY